jgi:hypothetical protein
MDEMWLLLRGAQTMVSLEIIQALAGRQSPKRKSVASVSG